MAINSRTREHDEQDRRKNDEQPREEEERKGARWRLRGEARVGEKTCQGTHAAGY